MKKEEVYVEVRTEKQARKLKKVLDIFNQKVYDSHTIMPGFMIGFAYNTSRGDCFLNKSHESYDRDWLDGIVKTKVSIKQLRNILAREHLKEGDIVVVRGSISRNEYIVKVGLKRISGDLKICLLESPYYVRGEVGELGNERGVYGDFIRYATEEEKSLFDVKETSMSDGWYAHERFPKFMMYLKNIGKCNESRFGFDFFGDWFDEIVIKDSLDGYIKVSDKEVSNRLFAEAERRGLVKGVRIKSDWISGGVSATSIEKTSYSYSNNAVWTTGDCSYTLFKDGKWASVIEETPEQKVVKYAESVDWDFEKVVENIESTTKSCISYKEWAGLDGRESSDKVNLIFKKHNPHWEVKKAFANGAEVQYLSKLSNGWITDPTPSWNPLYEYRIRPVKTGDWYSYKSGSILKFTKVTESNLAHFQKREGKRITDEALIEYLNSM